MKKSSFGQLPCAVFVGFALCVSVTPRIAYAQTSAQNASVTRPLQSLNGKLTIAQQANNNQPIAWLPDYKEIKSMPPRVPVLPQADWGWNAMEYTTWPGTGQPFPVGLWTWLNGSFLAKRCLSSVKPSLTSIVIDSLQEFRPPKQTNFQDVLAIRNVIERSPEVSYTELTEVKLDEQLAQMGTFGLKAKGFEAIRWTMPGNELIYGVRGSDACVMQIKAQAPVRPSFQLLLEFSGVSSANYVSGKKLINEKHNVWPSHFTWADSINLRVVEAHANAEEFRGVYIMKGSFGVDDDRISRLDVYQGKGIARIVMQPASLADVQRLGMDSVQSAFPPSQSVEFSFMQHYSFIPNGATNVESNKKYEAYFGTLNPVTAKHWVFRYGSEAVKKKVGTELFGVGSDAVSLRAADRSIAIGIIPKKYWIPEKVDLLGSTDYLTFEMSQIHRKPLEFISSLQLLPPKLGEGLAKGLSEYLFVSEISGKKASALVRFVTAPALPDTIVDVYSEAIKLTDKEAAMLAGRLNLSVKKVSTVSKIK